VGLLRFFQNIKWVKKQECTRIIWPVRLFVFLLFIIFGVVFITHFPHYLAKSEPVKNCRILVLDGLIPDYAIEEAIHIYYTEKYEIIVTTGGSAYAGFSLLGKKSMAEITYLTFLEYGFNKNNIVFLPVGNILRDRTYTSALRLKEWLNTYETDNKSINIVAMGCHAQRSKYLFQKALGNDYFVGVIAVPDQSYDIDHWWKSSKGFRTVFSEIIAFFYSRCRYNYEKIFQKN